MLLDLKGNILVQCKTLMPLGLNLFLVGDEEWTFKGKIIDGKGNIISDDIYEDVSAYDVFSKIVSKKSGGNYVILLATSD